MIYKESNLTVSKVYTKCGISHVIHDEIQIQKSVILKYRFKDVIHDIANEDEEESGEESSVVRCSLLLRILKVYRTETHSGYIQYTYRGFHIPHRVSALAETSRCCVSSLAGRILIVQQLL